MDLLIDGYNLIFQCGLLGRRTDSSALEAARNRLISELTSRLGDELRLRTTIIFDAANRPIKAVSDDHRVNSMRVLFAVNHDEADELIEELILKHSNPKNLLVVSSDHRIHKAALRRKSTPVDSDVFWFEKLDHLQNQSGDQRTPIPDGPGPDEEKQLPVGLNDVDWEEEFGLKNGFEEPDREKPASNLPSPFPPGYGEDLLENDDD